VWAVVLAGGEGSRLRPLLRRVLGEERPPQYVPLLGPRSLLRETLDRTALRIPAARTVVVTVRAHVPHIAQEFTGVPDPPYVLLQPRDRGTGPAVLHAARWIARRDPEAMLAVFPSDQFVLGAATFMAHVLDVARAMESSPERVALLGATPSAAGSDHGWIEPDAPAPLPDAVPTPRGDRDDALASVRTIMLEPSESAFGRWNTGVAVGSAAALIALGGRAHPEVSALLDRAHGLEEPDASALRDAYAPMETVSFEEMAAAEPGRLALSSLPRLTWCDLGHPDGLLAVLARMRVRPAWADAIDPAAVPA
jgi:mannose-1-phosphate guanylyltransferase